VNLTSLDFLGGLISGGFGSGSGKFSGSGKSFFAENGHVLISSLEEIFSLVLFVVSFCCREDLFFFLLFLFLLLVCACSNFCRSDIYYMFLFLALYIFFFYFYVNKHSRNLICS
jgi:hypothetical protein